MGEKRTWRGGLLLVLFAALAAACFLPVTAHAADGADAEAAIYLNGESGSDSGDGSASQPVGTYQRAAELAADRGVSTVYVTGTVTVSDTETWSDGLTLVRAEGFTNGSLVYVTDGGELTLGNVTLDGASVGTTASPTAANEDAANLLRVEGTLNIGEGALVENHQGGGAYSAAVLVYGGTLNMSGGTIDHNEGGSWGGGVSLVGAPDNPASMTLTGGTISNNAARTNGGGIYLYTHTSLTMDGGVVTGNSAPNNGGGIYVGRDATATIESGYITNNSQTASTNYGGGGIYVESNQNYATSEPGKLYLYNAEISENSCGSSAADLGYDAAISACNTAVLQVNITDGAVIHDNDTTYDIMSYFDSSTASSNISPFMLGGGLYNWVDQNGDAYGIGEVMWQGVTGWQYASTSASVGDGTVTGLGRTRTHITGNSAVVLGAAIGTNGEVYIGKSDGDVTLTINKVWDESVADRADSVTVMVYATDGSGTTTQIGSVVLSEDNDWTSTIAHLPKWDSDGSAYTYSVAEEDAGYRVEVTRTQLADDDGDDSTDAYEFTVTNSAPEPVVSEGFVARKVLEGADLEAGQFAFELRDADGNVVQTVTNDGSGMVRFEGIEFSEPGIYLYTISEVNDGQSDVTYDDSVKGCRVTVTQEGGVLTAVSTADEELVFTNTYKAAAATTTEGAATNSGLPKTSDPTSLVGVGAALVGGLGAGVAGLVLRRRSK
ncbi:Spy0128 family protein [Thermophilibacter sp.]